MLLFCLLETVIGLFYLVLIFGIEILELRFCKRVLSMHMMTVRVTGISYSPITDVYFDQEMTGSSYRIDVTQMWRATDEWD